MEFHFIVKLANLVKRGIIVPVRAEGNKIVEIATGKIVGRSKTPEKAQAAARVRNAIHFTNWRPTRGPKRAVKEGGVDRK